MTDLHFVPAPNGLKAKLFMQKPWLADRPFSADDFSIADIACYRWIVPYEAQGQDLAEFPNVKRWFENMAARPAAVRTYVRCRECPCVQAGDIGGRTRHAVQARRKGSRLNPPHPKRLLTGTVIARV